MAQKKQKKSSGTLPLFIGAVGFGLAAAFLSVLYLKAREADLRARLAGPVEQKVEVVVASHDLKRGALISGDNFAVREVPAVYVHDDAVHPGDYDRFKGRALTTTLGAGKPLLKSFLDVNFPVDFSDTIPRGKRALTVTVDEVNSVAGFIRPGNRIDILVNIPYSQSGFDPKFYSVGLFKALPAGFDRPAIKSQFNKILNQPPEQIAELLKSLAPGDVILPVLQGVRVLATGRDPYIESLDQLRQPQFRSDTNFTSVTLDVTPQQAALVTAAQDKGDLLAILRNRKDQGAASFTTVSSRDLFANAAQMAAAEKERASRTTVAAGVDASGNLVDANGNALLSQEQLTAAGYTVNENGQIVDKDGNVVDPKDIVVAADGTVMNRQQLAAAGLSVNASGQIVDRNGNVVSASDVIVAADGTTMTKEQLAAAGLSVNANGEIVDANGQILSPKDIIVTKDGTVLSKEQLAAAGFTVNADGQIVDKDGNIVDPKDIVIAADGTVLSKEQLAAAGFTVNADGQIVDKDGNVVDPKELVTASDGSIMTRQQLAAAGLSINEQGQVVDKNGNVVDQDDLITAADGTVLSKKQLAAAGLSVNANGEIVNAEGKAVSAEEIARVARNIPITGTSEATGSYNLVIGGASKDGVAKSQSVPIQD
ncbi:MAG: Flp pilus assembly protein CpaB [Gammaproteobacteria bacterium]